MFYNMYRQVILSVNFISYTTKNLFKRGSSGKIGLRATKSDLQRPEAEELGNRT